MVCSTSQYNYGEFILNRHMCFYFKKKKKSNENKPTEVSHVHAVSWSLANLAFASNKQKVKKEACL